MRPPKIVSAHTGGLKMKLVTLSSDKGRSKWMTQKNVRIKFVNQNF
jgi:hypothetical protein